MSATEPSIRRRVGSALAGCLVLVLAGDCATSSSPVPPAGRERTSELWVTETALSTALNMSYMAEQMALFGIVVGAAPHDAGVID